MVDTARTQTVFLDIVGFTKNRSVEAQSDVVAAMNDVVSKAMDGTQVSTEGTVLLPTGDGMAIALTDVAEVDLHLRLALDVLRLVAEHNVSETNAMRRFDVRIGINENVDNLVTDINGRLYRTRIPGHEAVLTRRPPEPLERTTPRGSLRG